MVIQCVISLTSPITFKFYYHWNCSRSRFRMYFAVLFTQRIMGAPMNPDNEKSYSSIETHTCQLEYIHVYWKKFFQSNQQILLSSLANCTSHMLPIIFDLPFRVGDVRKFGNGISQRYERGRVNYERIGEPQSQERGSTT